MPTCPSIPICSYLGTYQKKHVLEHDISQLCNFWPLKQIDNSLHILSCCRSKHILDNLHTNRHNEEIHALPKNVWANPTTCCFTLINVAKLQKYAPNVSKVALGYIYVSPLGLICGWWHGKWCMLMLARMEVSCCQLQMTSSCLFFAPRLPCFPNPLHATDASYDSTLTPSNASYLLVGGGPAFPSQFSSLHTELVWHFVFLYVHIVVAACILWFYDCKMSMMQGSMGCVDGKVRVKVEGVVNLYVNPFYTEGPNITLDRKYVVSRKTFA